jgi:uncharacterized protein
MTRSAFTASRVVAWLARLVCALALWAPGAALARDVPPLRGHVNDTADMLSAEAEQALEQKLADYEQRTHHQFALLTLDSLEGDALEDFSIRVVEAWKLGQKGKDDGLLLLVVKRERKLRIEVGYGLEGDVTDAFSSQVIRNVLTPALRAGNAESGIQRAFDVLMPKAAGEAVPEGAVASPRRGSGKPSVFALFGLAFFLLPFLLPLLFLRGRGRRAGFLVGGLGGWGGGGWGGGGWGGRGGGGGWGGGGGGGGGWSGGGGGFGGGGSSGSW